MAHLSHFLVKSESSNKILHSGGPRQGGVLERILIPTKGKRDENIKNKGLGT